MSNGNVVDEMVTFWPIALLKELASLARRISASLILLPEIFSSGNYFFDRDFSSSVFANMRHPLIGTVHMAAQRDCGMDECDGTFKFGAAVESTLLFLESTFISGHSEKRRIAHSISIGN